MSSKSSNRVALAVRSETTQNTAHIIGAADFLLVKIPTYEMVVEKLKRDFGHTSWDPLPFVSGKVYQKLDFAMHMKGSGVLNTAYGPLHAALQMMGFVPSGGSAADWVFNQNSSPISQMLGAATSATIEGIFDGIFHLLPGCIASGKMTLTPGEMVELALSCQGIYAAVTDFAGWPASPTQTVNSLQAPIFQNASILIDNMTFEVKKIEIDFGQKVELIEDGNAPYGIAGFRITGRDPKVTLSIAEAAIATYDCWGKYVSSAGLITAGNGLTFNIGSAQYNKFSIAMPSLQIETLKRSNVKGIQCLDLGCQVNQNTGDDSIVITVNNS